MAIPALRKCIESEAMAGGIVNSKLPFPPARPQEAERVTSVGETVISCAPIEQCPL